MNIVMQNHQVIGMKNKKVLSKLVTLSTSNTQKFKKIIPQEEEMNTNRRLKRAVYAVMALNRLKNPPITTIDKSVP